jgi:hypothetical protein
MADGAGAPVSYRCPLDLYHKGEGGKWSAVAPARTLRAHHQGLEPQGTAGRPGRSHEGAGGMLRGGGPAAAAGQRRPAAPRRHAPGSAPWQYSRGRTRGRWQGHRVHSEPDAQRA